MRQQIQTERAVKPKAPVHKLSYLVAGMFSFPADERFGVCWPGSALAYVRGRLR